MPTARILIANKEVELLQKNDRHLFMFGYGLIDKISCNYLETIQSLSTWVEQYFEEGTVIVVQLGKKQNITEMLIYRGINSNYDIYYAKDLNGNKLIFSDTFRNILSQIPLAKRHANRNGIIDHYLFRIAPCYSSYIEGIERVGHGDGLRITFGSGDPEISKLRMGKLAPRDMEECSEPDQAECLEKALRQALAVIKPSDADYTLFSGGIDSSILQFLSPHSIPITVAIDSPEFAFEISYSKKAGKLIGDEGRFVWIAENDYQTLLEEAIESLALPPHHLQTVLIDAAFQNFGAHRFFSGQFADGVFGFPAARFAQISYYASPLIQIAAWAKLQDIPFGGIWLDRIKKIIDANGSLKKPILDNTGFSYNFATFTSRESVDKIFGRDAVEDRLQARMAYAHERVELSTENNIYRQLEMAQWLDFFCEETGSLWRQLALSRNAALYTPFSSKSAINFALSIPAKKRYIHGFQSKYFPKQLLRKLIPTYPVNQQKGASGLPFQRYFLTGPLKNIFKKYPIPEHFPKDIKQQIAMQPTWLTWNAICYTIWEHLVFKNSNLNLIPGSRIEEYLIG